MRAFSRNFLFSVLSAILLVGVLSNCGNVPNLPQADQLYTPSLLSSSGSEFDLTQNLHLVGKLEAFDGDQVAQEFDLEVQSVFLDPDRPDGAKYLRMIPKEGIRIEHLKSGNHLFRMRLFHDDEALGRIELAKIETTVDFVSGKNTPIHFDQSSWDYTFDDDGDGFTNIAELTNGYYLPQDKGKGDQKNWQAAKTNPKDLNDHPSQNFVLANGRIGATSPNAEGNSFLIGDARSVQAGTKFTVFHKKADGSIEKIIFYSKLDGSFEVEIKGGAANDEIAVVVSSVLQGDEILPPPDLIKNNPSFGTSITIKYLPIKIVKCHPLPNKESIAGNSSVILEGESISSIPSENQVFFPKLGGGYVQASDLKITGQTARTVELTVQIPSNAISGFPYVHTKTPQLESYGQCPKNQDIVVIQNNGKELPDLYITLVDAPYVALLGQAINIDIHIANQGLKGVENTVFPYSSYISTAAAGSENVDLITPEPEGSDRDIFPGSLNLGEPQVRTGEQINTPIKRGEWIKPSRNSYFLSRLSKTGTGELYAGSVLFKAAVDPLSGGVFGGGNSLLEQDESNNSRAAVHNTYIHYVNLNFLKQGSQILVGNSGPLTLVSKPEGYLAVELRQSLNLTRSGSVAIRLGGLPLKNDGTFPLNRQKVGEQVEYLSEDDNDPLNTLGKTYLDTKALIESQDYGDKEKDLQRSLALELLEQADLFNQQIGYPVLLHVYYSDNDKFVPSILYADKGDKVDSIVCAKGDCELCSNRLERKQSMPIKDLTIPLDSSALLPGDQGNLFVVAEVMQLDPNKLGPTTKRDANGDFDYCQASLEDRNKDFDLIYSGGNSGTPLLDSNPLDNIIKIPIQAFATDLEFAPSPQITGGNNISLGSDFQVSFQLNNNGELATPVAPKVQGSFFDPVTKLKAPAGALLNLPSPIAALSNSGNQVLPVNLSGGTIEDWEKVPLGSAQLWLEADPQNEIFEANRSRTGEINNIAKIPINIVAPDLKIYGLGFSRSSGGVCDNSGNCNLETSIGSNFSLDVYVINEGNGPAKAGVPIQMQAINEKGTACFNTTMASTAVPLNSGQVLKVPVTVTVSGKLECYNATGVSVSGEINPTHSLIEKNAKGVLDAFSNNKAIPKRFTMKDLGSDPFDPKTKAGDFTDLTPSGGVIDLKAKIKKWDLAVVSGTMGEPAVQITGRKSGDLIGMNQPYTVQFFVKNSGDGASPNQIPVVVYLKDKSGMKYPFIPQESGSDRIPAISPDAKPYLQTILVKTPYQKPIKDLLTTDLYQIEVMVNSDLNLEEENKNDNYKTSDDSYKISHYDLSAMIDSDLSKAVTFPTCDSNKTIPCSFGVVGENATLNFKVRAVGSEEYTIPGRKAIVNAGIKNVAVIIPSLTIGSNGTVEQSLSGTIQLQKTDTQIGVQVEAPMPGDVEFDGNNNNAASSSFVMHERPRVTWPIDPDDPMPDPMYKPTVTSFSGAGCGRFATCDKISNLRSTCVDTEATGEVQIVLKWEEQNKKDACLPPASSPSNAPQTATAECTMVRGMTPQTFNFRLSCISQKKDGTPLVYGASSYFTWTTP